MSERRYLVSSVIVAATSTGMRGITNLGTGRSNKASLVNVTKSYALSLAAKRTSLSSITACRGPFVLARKLYKLTAKVNVNVGYNVDNLESIGSNATVDNRFAYYLSAAHGKLISCIYSSSKGEIVLFLYNVRCLCNGYTFADGDAYGIYGCGYVHFILTSVT